VVDVDDALLVAKHEPGGKDTHVAGQHDQVGSNSSSTSPSDVLARRDPRLREVCERNAVALANSRAAVRSLTRAMTSQSAVDGASRMRSLGSEASRNRAPPLESGDEQSGSSYRSWERRLNHVETPSEFQGVHSFSYLHAAPKSPSTTSRAGPIQRCCAAPECWRPDWRRSHPVRGSHVRMSPFDQSSPTVT